MSRQRMERVASKMLESDISQAYITDPLAIKYLSDQWIDTGERLLAIYFDAENIDNSKFIYNKMFTVPSDPGMEVISYVDVDDKGKLLTSFLKEGKSLGVDKIMQAQFLLPVYNSGKVSRIVNASGCVDAVRAIKDAEEIALLRRANEINDLGMQELKEMLKCGVTETEIGPQLDEVFRKLGADGNGFFPSVDFGPHAAIIHHAAENTPLKPGDCALLDIGCKVNFYVSDMTRTFFCKEVSAKHERIYNEIRKTSDYLESIIKPGMRFCDIDMAAHEALDQDGIREFRFAHRLGHFIGMEAHEAGDVSSINTELVQVGNVFSLEPAVYIPGEVGIRIEDIVVITEDGCEPLNKFSKDLQIVG